MNAQPKATQKSERLEARVTAEQKALIERASALAGRSVSEFVTSAAFAAAQSAIREHEKMVLSEADALAFAQALDRPPEPDGKNREAVRRYKSHVTSL